MRKLLVLLAAVAFVVAFTVPAMSADWGFYGSARMYTFMDDRSKEVSGLGVSDDDLSWFLQGNSRIGAKVKNGDIAGRFEYGSGPNLRLLNAAWKFGAGTLVVGQDYSPIDTFISNQQGPPKWGGDIDGLPWGGIYDGRTAQLKLKMASFQVALVQPKVVSVVAANDTDTSMPKIEACYNFKTGPLALKVLGAMNTHDDVVIAGTTETSHSVDSNVFGVMAKYATGPFSVAADLYMATNPGNFGLLVDNAVSKAAFASNAIQDSDAMGALVVLGYKASDMIKLEAGYGMVACEREVAGVTTEATTTSMYVQAVITMAKGFYIVPEFGTVDYGDLEVTGAPDTKQGDISYFGAKWHINF
ncbi:MAG: hypothetical protein JRJ70_17750 [Deltaproteobacteria bacterium]|nr:hypothetical protein [Deltaproteobacteria bacterium]